MSEQEDEKILRYGQIILLHFFDDEDAYISADGHVKKHMFKQEVIIKISCVQKKQELKKINKDDFSNCLFQIYPKVVNTQKSKIIKEIESYKRQKLKEEDQNELTKEKLQMLKYSSPSEKELKDKDNKVKKRGEDQAKVLDLLEDDFDDKDQFLKRISKHQITLQNEFKYNVDTFENNKNLPVFYNQPIQLLHLNSSRFLSCNFVESKHEKENYEISLEEYSSDSTLFKIIPAFKYQKDSSQVINEGDCIWIIRAFPFNNKTIHLHCSIELQEMKQRKCSTSKKIETYDNPQFNTKIQKREINGCLEQASTIKFKIFQEVEHSKSKYLNCGDAIWLHHLEVNSPLSAIRRERGTTRYTFTSLNIEQWISQQNLEIFVAQTRESLSFEDYFGNSFGLWIVENVDFKKGGYVEYGVGYRLKHMPTGQYLSVIDENELIMEQKLKLIEKQKEELLKKKINKNTQQINKTRYDELSEESNEDKEDENEKDDQILERGEKDEEDVEDGFQSGEENKKEHSALLKKKKKIKINQTKKKNY